MISSSLHKITCVLRLSRAGLTLARHGVIEDILPGSAPAPVRLFARGLSLMKRRGTGDEDALIDALQRLGPSYIKLGQFLSTRADIVGPRRARVFSRLRDQLPCFPRLEAARVVEATLGDATERVFSGFEDARVAASMAQVHKARISDGKGKDRPVAVKILRPDIEKRFTRDIEAFRFAARFAARYIPSLRRLKPVAVVDELARSVALEMDLLMEAAAISEMAENISGDEGFRVPRVDWGRSSKQVLTMEWIDGIPLGDRDALIAAGHDLPRLARVLVQSFLRHAMRDGFFHADLHQGNLFVDVRGDLVAVDFGIMGRLGLKERRFLAEILWGFIKRDYKRVAEVHFEAGYVPPHHRQEHFAQALRAIGEPLMDQVAEDVSMARLLTQLFEVTVLFDMETRPELLLLQKTMVVVEGAARELDPRFNMWSTAEPVAHQWMQDNLGVAGYVRNIVAETRSMGRLVNRLPDILAWAERSMNHVTMTERGECLESEDDMLVMRRLKIRTFALWIGALALVVIALRSF